MKVVSAALAAITVFAAQALLAQSALAQDNAPWLRAEVPSGTATVELPCSEEESLVGADEVVEIAACNWAGFEIVLLVMPETEWDIEGVTDRPFEQTREQLREDPTTDYVLENELGGASAFFAEGTSDQGKVGTAMVDLNAGRLLVLLVQSDGSPAAEDSLSQVFARVRGSLEVVTQ